MFSIYKNLRIEFITFLAGRNLRLSLISSIKFIIFSQENFFPKIVFSSYWARGIERRNLFGDTQLKMFHENFGKSENFLPREVTFSNFVSHENCEAPIIVIIGVVQDKNFFKDVNVF